MKAFFEETAKQIYKIFLSGSDINTPVVIMLFWTRPTPRVAHPSPLKKNRREGHLVVKNGIMLHELNSMAQRGQPLLLYAVGCIMDQIMDLKIDFKGCIRATWK